MATLTERQSFEDLYEFRPLNRNDLKAVRLLHDELLPVKYSDNFYKAMLNGVYKSLLLYAKDADILIGISTWKIEHRQINDDYDTKKIQIGYLATFGIRNNFRRKGLGKYLLLSTLSMMQEMKCKLCELHVLSTNYAAKNLYEKCHFIVKLKLPNHYHFDNKLHDAFLLIKSLTPNHIQLDDDDEEESKSIQQYDNRQHSPPSHYAENNGDDNKRKEDKNEMESLEHDTLINIDNNVTTVLPISNWIAPQIDSLWIKCIIL